MDLLEEIIDNLIEYDNGGSDSYTTGDVADKCFELRKLIARQKRLVKIGKATEKVFDDGYMLNNDRYVIPDVESLLKRYESESE